MRRRRSKVAKISAPLFDATESHYSLIARSEALRRYFVEGCCWEEAAPLVIHLTLFSPSKVVLWTWSLYRAWLRVPRGRHGHRCGENASR